MSDGTPLPPHLKMQVFDGSHRLTNVKVPASGDVELSDLAPGDYRVQTGGAGANFLAASPLHVASTGPCKIAINMAGRTDANQTIVEDELSVEDLRISSRARAAFRTGFVDFEGGQLEKARNAFLEVTKQAPNLSRAYNILGVISVQQGDGDAARQFFDKALELNPRGKAALLNLAKLSMSQRQYEAAVSLLERYRSGSRDVADVHAMEAEAYLKLGRFSEAIREADAAHALPHGNLPNVHVIAAAAFEAVHQPEKAVPEYRLYLAESTTEPMRERAAERIRELTTTAAQQSAQQVPMNSLLPH